MTKLPLCIIPRWVVFSVGEGMFCPSHTTHTLSDWLPLPSTFYIHPPILSLTLHLPLNRHMCDLNATYDEGGWFSITDPTPLSAQWMQTWWKTTTTTLPPSFSCCHLPRNEINVIIALHISFTCVTHANINNEMNVLPLLDWLAWTCTGTADFWYWLGKFAQWSTIGLLLLLLPF